MCSFFRYLICFLSLLSQDGFSVAMDTYQCSWTQSSAVSDIEFHKSVAKRIADAMARRDLEKNRNIAGFGVTVRAKCIEDGRNDVFFVEFPKLFDSSYSVAEDNPFFEADGSQIIAVSDMFRGKALAGESKKHNLCSFILWLQSKSHVAEKDLSSDLQSVLRCIENGNAGQMARIIDNGERFKELHHFLHCEQLFLYNLFKDETIWEVLFSHLQDQGAFLKLLDGKHDNLEFFLEICTYNDMCLRCYESSCALQAELKEKIGQVLLKKFASSNVLSRYITRCFPVNLKIRVSSFRPFEYQRGCFTRNEAHLPDYTTYSRAIIPKEYKESNVQQFFNPWISQHIFSYQVNDFITSAERLREGDKFIDNWRLEEKFKVLSAEIDQSVKHRIADALVSKKAVLARPEVCCSILGFSIDLACQISEHKDMYYSLVRDLAAVAMVKGEQLPRLIEHLRTIPGDSAEITAAINDQKMLKNACELIDMSHPSGPWYNFDGMKKIAKEISLCDVHPIIAKFIKDNIDPSKLIKKTWQRDPPSYTELSRILTDIISK